MKTLLSIKIDKDVKEKAQALAKNLGIPLSIVVNAYLKEFIYSGEFKIAREPITARFETIIDQIEKEVAQGKVSKKFKSAKSLIGDLHK